MNSLISLFDEKINFDVVKNVLVPYLEPEEVDSYNIGYFNLFWRIDRIKDVNDCFKGAYRGGHMDIVLLMFEKRGLYGFDWDNGLYRACLGGHMDIILSMIEKCSSDELDWNTGLDGACRGGYMDIVNLMIEKGATDWNLGLCEACRGGYINIVNLMIEKGATKCYCEKSLEEH